jgi:hypothetical protein
LEREFILPLQLFIIFLESSTAESILFPEPIKIANNSAWLSVVEPFNTNFSLGLSSSD